MKNFRSRSQTAVQAGLTVLLLAAWLTVVPGLSMDACSRCETAAAGEEEETSWHLWIVDFIESFF